MIDAAAADTIPARMSRKVRTPPPPRRSVQAPKQRSAPRDEGRNRKIIYAIAASGLVILAAALGFFFLAGGDDDGAAQENAVATLRAAGWTYQRPKGQGRTHVPALPAGYKYNTVPATSGNHSNQTVIYGVYDQQVSEFNYVHNLEHGAIGMFYGPDVPESVRAQMQEYYSEEPNGLILALDNRLGDQIALTAWTHIAKGKAFDGEVFDTFVDTFGFKGPESCKSSIEQGCFRRENLEVGSQ